MADDKSAKDDEGIGVECFPEPNKVLEWNLRSRAVLSYTSTVITGRCSENNELALAQNCILDFSDLFSDIACRVERTRHICSVEISYGQKYPRFVLRKSA